MGTALTQDVLCETRGPLGLVTLNRPKALNALTLGMIRVLDPQLQAWARDPAVTAVLIRGAGDRAFCAGGDVRAVHDDGLAWKKGESDGALTRDFFREEYILNHRIKRFPKPFVALLDGITMGGGVGLSVHGSHRVVTEKTLFAMPETGIGLFPDVGGTYFLPRLPGRIGTYLALTGARLKAVDLLHTGIATHHVPGDRLDTLVDDLAAALGRGGAAPEAVSAVLDRHASEPAGEALIEPFRHEIDHSFAFSSVEEIMAALEQYGTGWSQETARTMAGLSPTSLKVTLKQMRVGEGLDFDACMQLEYRMTQAFMAGHDFYEGIRAVLVDKDRTPRWQPATLAEVTEEMVNRHFAPVGTRELVFTD
ncbi:enoyl-CoA hydratase/isomerase family protein [Rhodospirillum centenum]|uniref:3-hydroxyisobutyryl-CoA hydrolase n=1 Tax=Rhodospirillum centenum (strain ATCC 51521 / SW) TaxID=414684 RepID=B6IMT6_RHOCS|nr:enoyl-CoA hydratase/isomerase family protein [Rhodospirillum centenum]ACI98752.1 enoyl-CoA hydratase [Rhodospirillum centenum SW]